MYSHVSVPVLENSFIVKHTQSRALTLDLHVQLLNSTLQFCCETRLHPEHPLAQAAQRRFDYCSRFEGAAWHRFWRTQRRGVDSLRHKKDNFRVAQSLMQRLRRARRRPLAVLDFELPDSPISSTASSLGMSGNWRSVLSPVSGNASAATNRTENSMHRLLKRINEHRSVKSPWSRNGVPVTFGTPKNDTTSTGKNQHADNGVSRSKGAEYLSDDDDEHGTWHRPSGCSWHRTGTAAN
ncbi:MAG: hypothetical protein MHM6MM_002661 [Cercozoa sp. M6MM]